MENFEKLNPDWREEEDRTGFDKKYKDFDSYLASHTTLRHPEKLEAWCMRYDMWREFQENKRPPIIEANKLFDKFFFKKDKGRYSSNPDIVFVRHVFADLVEKGKFTIDCRGIILHEKVEMLNWVNKFGDCKRAFREIERGAYEKEISRGVGKDTKILLSKYKIPMTAYWVAHSPAIRIEYGLYQWLGAHIVSGAIPFKAFLYMHPMREARDPADPLRSALTFVLNEKYLKEPIGREHLEMAARVFEEGGYKYGHKKEMIDTALDVANKLL